MAGGGRGCRNRCGSSGADAWLGLYGRGNIVRHGRRVVRQAELVGDAGETPDDPQGIYGEELRQGLAHGITRVLADLETYQKRARARAVERLDIRQVTLKYLRALDLPSDREPGVGRRA